MEFLPRQTYQRSSADQFVYRGVLGGEGQKTAGFTQPYQSNRDLFHPHSYKCL